MAKHTCPACSHVFESAGKKSKSAASRPDLAPVPFEREGQTWYSNATLCFDGTVKRGWASFPVSAKEVLASFARRLGMRKKFSTEARNAGLAAVGGGFNLNAYIERARKWQEVWGPVEASCEGFNNKYQEYRSDMAYEQAQKANADIDYQRARLQNNSLA